MKRENTKIVYADDDTESIGVLLKLRIPPLLIGLGLGIAISFATSRFEEVLAHNIRVAFFLPFIVYMADAIGTQTQSIYARDLKSGKAKFRNYLIKESALGLVLGLLLGIISGMVVWLWIKERLLAMSVGISMFSAAFSAPLIALIITEIIALTHEDPAVGAGPIATVIQDMMSVIIYGTISSFVLL